MPLSSEVVRLGFIRTESDTAPSFELRPPAPTPKARPGFRTIEDLVREREATPDGRAGMAEARADLAAHLRSRNLPLSLNQLRLARGLSQAQLADRMGTSQPHIARIESGREDVQVSTLFKVAEALETEPRKVFEAFAAKFKP